MSAILSEHGQRPRLVDDLIPVILENSNSWWPQDLLSLSTVSFSWLHAIRKRLYAVPVLLSYHSCSLLAETLQRNDHLLGMVKGIDIRPLRTGWPECGRPSMKQMASVRFILGLEGLECVTLGGELAVSAHRYLNAMSHPHCVRRLWVDGSLQKESLHSPPSLEWDEGLAFKFARLENLQLSNLDLDIVFPSVPYPLRVTSLVLDTVRITNGHLIHLLHETSSLTQLWVTTERSGDFHEQIRPMLDLHPIAELHYEMQCDDPLPFDPSSFESPVHISLSRLCLIDTPVCPATLQSIEAVLSNIGGARCDWEKQSNHGRRVGYVRELDNIVYSSGAWSAQRNELPSVSAVVSFDRNTGAKRIISSRHSFVVHWV
ncbi:hypothetical protein IW261DRAFT_1504737, partial [Armillaria novae-zelandiae]